LKIYETIIEQAVTLLYINYNVVFVLSNSIRYKNSSVSLNIDLSFVKYRYFTIVYILFLAWESAPYFFPLFFPKYCSINININERHEQVRGVVVRASTLWKKGNEALVLNAS
jgi:hypothetical protein